MLNTLEIICLFHDQEVFWLVVKKENTQDMTTDDLTQVLEVINAEGDTGEMEEILEKNPNLEQRSQSELGQ